MSRRNLLSPSRSCQRCAQGNHGECLGHPDADGSWWVTDPETGKRRKAIFEGGIYSEEGRGKEIPRPPCECAESGHAGEPETCSALTGEFHYRCGRPVKDTITRKNYKGEKYEIPVCGIHAYAERRKRESDAKWKAQWEARKEKDKKTRNNREASEEWAKKLYEEFGLPTEAMAAGPNKIRVALSPEMTYALLDQVRVLLDDVYEDHPFKFGTVEDV